MAIDTAQGDFYAALTAAINQQITPQYDLALTLIQYQGDFLWWYQNPNLVFNQGTFDYISARVFPGNVERTAQLSPSGGFPNAYAQLIAKIVYQLSTADQATIDSASSNAAAAAATIVSDYETTFGQITSADMQAAQAACGVFAVQTFLDYVISYVLGYVWSACQQNRQPPLTYQQMSAAPSLLDLLPQRPANSGVVVVDVAAYFEMMSPVAELQSRVQMGNWIVAQLAENTGAPSSANGGMTTVDPQTGAVSPSFQVGYAIGRRLSDIQNDLNNSQRTFTVTLDVSPDSQGNMSVAIDGSPTLSSRVALSFCQQDGHQYNLNMLAGAGSESLVTIEYPGYTLVPVQPASWQPEANVGWYYTNPLAEALSNGAQDVTGFRFVAPPAYNLQSLANGGEFGTLTNLLISNYPNVTVTYKNADFAAFSQIWPQTLRGYITLFGHLNLGSSSQPYVSTYEPGSSNSEFALTFLPQAIPVPLLQKAAFVIGGSIGNPGVTPPGPSLVSRLVGA